MEGMFEEGLSPWSVLKLTMIMMILMIMMMKMIDVLTFALRNEES
jgi:hypothetical protein